MPGSITCLRVQGICRSEAWWAAGAIGLLRLKEHQALRGCEQVQEEHPELDFRYGALAGRGGDSASQRRSSKANP